VSRAKAKSSIAPRLLRWHAEHGRHDLPWQKRRTAYRVWVSEIMLQQTQVSTVIPYYRRFMARFPNVVALADAPLDDVLHLWAGLGYYARARNLHRAAQRVRDEHKGRFPQEFAQVAELPGIGRSTAGAILALAHDQRHPILDGNVRRVLSRYFLIEGSPDDKAVVDALWDLADANTPANDPATYTQAIMDLGATVCTRSKPLCMYCPLATNCGAKRTGRQAELPAPKRKKAARRTKTVEMLVARNCAGDVLLVKRPAAGIWGGLWCLPEFDDFESLNLFATAQLEAPELAAEPLPQIEHAFSHYDLVIRPRAARTKGLRDQVADSPAASIWYSFAQPAPLGLPAPISELLARLAPAGGASLPK
jgi:A/G-specific adenine glycosylase